MFKVMIADDEAIVCRGLEYMVQSQFPFVEVLMSAYNGIELLKRVTEEKPDIIIVDINMPGMNGLDVIEILRMRSCGAKIIINTAYSDFAYIQKALKLGADGYLLKPTDASQLRESMEKVLNLLEHEKKEKKDKEKTSLRMKKEQNIIESEMISSILLERPNEESFHVFMEMTGNSFWGGIMMGLQVEHYTVCLDAYEQELRQFWKHYCTCITKIYRNQLFLLIFPERNIDAENYREWMENLISKLQEEKNKTRFQFKIGISSWKYEFTQMEEAYHECQIALKECMPSEKNYKFYQEDIEGQAAFLKKTEELKQLFKTGKTEEFYAELRKMYQAYEERYGIDRYIQFYTVQLIAECRQCLDKEWESSAKKVFVMNDIKENIKKSDTAEKLIRQAAEMIQGDLPTANTADSRMIYMEKAILYIEKNYMRDISLEEIAKEISITPVYLSRLFKNLIHVNFVELLTNVRIMHAMELLQKTDATIKEIGERVGYQSPTYFYKVFKKNTGMTVSEIKEIWSHENG